MELMEGIFRFSWHSAPHKHCCISARAKRGLSHFNDGKPFFFFFFWETIGEIASMVYNGLALDPRGLSHRCQGSDESRILCDKAKPMDVLPGAVGEVRCHCASLCMPEGRWRQA